MKKLAGIAAVLLAVSLLLYPVQRPEQTPSQPEQGIDTPLQAHTLAAYGRFPMRFEANQGQTDERVDFLARGPGYTLFLTPNEAVLALRKGVPAQDTLRTEAVVRMRLVGADPTPAVQGEEALVTRTNYLLGNDSTQWHTHVPNYSRVRYAGVYPGIDVAYYGNPQQLEYDFIVAPGADPDDIVLHFDGAERMTLDDAGNLILHVDGGEVVQHAPVSYQEIEGTRRAVASRYVRIGALQVGVEVGAYDPNITLVIDPEIAYGTYLSGDGGATPHGLAVDAAGNRYIVGTTSATDFPTVNPIQDSRVGGGDLYIAKLNPGGTALLYATYLGGDGADTAAGIGLDAAGNAYIAGETRSENFPVKNAVQPGRSAGSALLTFDVFVAALNADGSDLIYSTYLGGSNNETTVGMGVDASGNAYVAGTTSSTDFRVSNAFQDTLAGIAGRADIFVAKFTSNGGLAYSTYLGGGSTDTAKGLGVDATGNAYVVGRSTSPDFPLRQDVTGSLPDAFVAKLNTNGQLDFASFFGFRGSYVAIDAEGQIYVWGTENLNFLTTPPVNAFQPTPGGGGQDGFLMKLNPTADAILYASYLGGSGVEGPYALVVDADGNAYVYGTTDSPDFPVKEAVQPDFGGNQDMFLAKVDAAGALEYATYLGGRGFEGPSTNSLAVDANGDVHFAIATDSRSLPTAPNAFQTSGRGPVTTYVGTLTEGAAVEIVIDLDLDQCINPGGSKRPPVVSKTADGCELLFSGVAYDPTRPVDNPLNPESVIPGITINSTGLDFSHVTGVAFEPSTGLSVKSNSIQASATGVDFDLTISHSTELGEFDLILLQDGQRPPINVTDRVGHPFTVTRILTTFNQAIDSRDLPTEAHRAIQIADKKGAVRIEFDDPAMYGQSVEGLLATDGKESISPTVHTPQAGYTEAEVLAGADYLSIPYPEPDPGRDGLRAGANSMICLLRIGNRLILCPFIELEFVESQRLDIVAVMYEIDGKSPPFTLAEAETAAEFMKKVYPLSANQFHYTSAKKVPLPVNIEVDDNGVLTDDGDFDLREKLDILRLARNKREDTQHHAVVAYLPEGALGNRVAGAAAPASCTSFIASNQAQLSQTIAHEIGHLVNCILGTLGDDVQALMEALEAPGSDLGDEYKGGLFACNINPPVSGLEGAPQEKDGPPQTCPDSRLIDGVHGNSIGTFVNTRSAYDPDTNAPRFRFEGTTQQTSRESYNFMSSVSGNSDSWVSARVYDQLYFTFFPELTTTGAASKIADVQILDVFGSIKDDGTTKLLDFTRLPGGYVTRASDGPYALEFQDANGTVLASHAFDVNFLLNSEPPKFVDYDFFHIRMEEPAGTKQVALKKDGVELTKRTLSDNPPTVAITSPQNGQPITGTINLEWTASDPDGGPLTYSLFFSTDGGETLIPLDALLTETSYELDTTPFASSSTLALTIIASDGLNQGEATVTLGTGSGAAPALAGITPGNAVQGATGITLTLQGQNFQNGATLSFSGSGITVTSFTRLSSTQLRATIDVAATAPPGPRDVIVTNPDGQSTTALSAFEVLELGALVAVLSWDPPPTGQTLVPPENLTVNFGGTAAPKTSATSRRIRRLAGGARTPSAAKHPRPRRHTPAADSTDEVEPNNTLGEAQVLTGISPLAVKGNAEVDDVGGIVITSSGGTIEDDLEDLFVVTTTAPGLHLTLDGITSDTDLYLIDEQITTLLGTSNQGGATQPEEIDLPELPAGTYLIGVSIYDPDPDGEPTTPYVLTVEGTFEDTSAEPTLLSYNIYRSLAPDPITTGAQLGSVPAAITTFADILPGNGLYYYQVTAVYDLGESAPSEETTLTVAVAVEETDAIPASFVLGQNYPNPFNPTTTIPFEVKEPGRVVLKVFDLLGRHVQTVVDGRHAPGRYQVRFDARGLPSGVYVYQLEAGSYRARKTMLVLK